MRLINRLLNTLGIDGAILYTSSARIIQAGGGIVTLLLIAKFLTSEEQGYYYTFGSILSMQIFFELGYKMVFFFISISSYSTINIWILFF